MSGIILGFWILVFIVRALSPQKEAPAKRRVEFIDGIGVVRIVAGLVGVFLLNAMIGPGWPQFLFCLWLVVLMPHWAVWRICQPLALRRTGLVLLAFVWGGSEAREGRRRLFEWSLGGGGGGEEGLEDGAPLTIRGLAYREARLVPADGWTTCAAALKADALEDVAHADRLVGGLTALPPGARVPRTVARLGYESLALAALRRDDWPSVLRRASLGRGRGCRFLRLLARTRLVGDVPPAWLWLAWLMAPHRWRTFGLMRDALDPGLEPSPAASRPPASSPWALHLRLLDRAARGETIERAQVLQLAESWDGPLGRKNLARLRARALELGVLDPEAACHAVHAAVLADLEVLAAVGEGAWPQERARPNGLSGLLVAGAENRLYADLEPWVAPYRNGGKADIKYPLAEWERWIAFRAALDRLQEALGEEAVVTSWYGGLRLAAWNWPCRLLDAHQERAAWACQVMFEWTAALAERIGDEEAAGTNHKNAGIAAGMVPR